MKNSTLSECSRSCDHEKLMHIIRMVVRDLATIFPDSLETAWLYGSYARGEQTEESDVDIALILNQKPSKDAMRRMVHCVAEYELECGKVLSVIDIDATRFHKHKESVPFYRNIEKEGIMLWKADYSVLSLESISEKILPIARKYDLDSVYVFGSYARGEATIASDVDLLIEGGEQMGLLALGGVREDFRNAIGRKIDMVTMDALLENADTRFTKNVLAERIKVYDKNR